MAFARARMNPTANVGFSEMASMKSSRESDRASRVGRPNCLGIRNTQDSEQTERHPARGSPHDHSVQHMLHRTFDDDVHPCLSIALLEDRSASAKQAKSAGAPLHTRRVRRASGLVQTA